ncbi:MAG: translation initiation factor IF-3 [Metamycoplasmataceae bacterium]
MSNYNKNKGPKSEHYVNETIIFPKLFVIDKNKEQLGIMTKQEAIQKAKDQNLDLVLISVSPKPIARIMDYGKFKYNKKKKQKEEKAKQTRIENREVRLTPLIGKNDLITKAKKAREFLLKGDVLKVSVKFKGREVQRKDLGYITLENFYKEVEDIASINGEINAKNERFLDMTLHQDKKKMQKYLSINNKNKEVNDAENEN